MSYTPVEQNEIRGRAALDLLRFKMLTAIEKNQTTYAPEIKVEELNEILIVAGMPAVIPAEVKVKELDVIQVNKEDEE